MIALLSECCCRISYECRVILWRDWTGMTSRSFTDISLYVPISEMPILNPNFYSDWMICPLVSSLVKNVSSEIINSSDKGLYYGSRYYYNQNNVLCDKLDFYIRALYA